LSKANLQGDILKYPNDSSKLFLLGYVVKDFH